MVSLVNGRPGAKNFTYSASLREFTKATNIRLRFLRTNTLLGHLISKAQRDPTVTRRVSTVFTQICSTIVFNLLETKKLSACFFTIKFYSDPPLNPHIFSRFVWSKKVTHSAQIYGGEVMINGFVIDCLLSLCLNMEGSWVHHRRYKEPKCTSSKLSYAGLRK